MPNFLFPTVKVALTYRPPFQRFFTIAQYFVKLIATPSMRKPSVGKQKITKTHFTWSKSLLSQTKNGWNKKIKNFCSIIEPLQSSDRTAHDKNKIRIIITQLRQILKDILFIFDGDRVCVVLFRLRLKGYTIERKEQNKTATKQKFENYFEEKCFFEKKKNNNNSGCQGGFNFPIFGFEIDIVLVTLWI